MAEDCRGSVAEVSVDELAGNYTMAEEGLAWGKLAGLVMEIGVLTVGEMCV